MQKDMVSGEGARDVLRRRHAREAHAAAVHELSERLTSIGNYLAAGVRLSEIAPPPGIPPPLSKVLTKALEQIEQANAVIHCYRKLLTKENEMEGDEQAIRERAYELWEKGGHPDGKDLEYWLRAEAEIAAKADPGVSDNGKIMEPSQAEVRKSATSG